MDIPWDGITRSDSLNETLVKVRTELADAARDYKWSRVIELISKYPEFANACRLGGRSLYAPLHQAAHAGASVDVVQRLIGMGAWRTLQSSRGERPIDVARRKGHGHLLGVLEPVCRHTVPTGVLPLIQSHFHEVIHGRAERLIREHALRLPELEPLLELEQPRMWFAVPGMYGGFSYVLEAAGAEAKLVSESWCRVVGGSGQRHEITSEGSQLTEEGFV